MAHGGTKARHARVVPVLDGLGNGAAEHLRRVKGLETQEAEEREDVLGFVVEGGAGEAESGAGLDSEAGFGQAGLGIADGVRLVQDDALEEQLEERGACFSFFLFGGGRRRGNQNIFTGSLNLP